MEGQTGTEQIVGGLSSPKKANGDIQAIVELVKPAVEKDMDMKLKEYDAKLYCTQVVAGTMYYIKIHIGPGDECIHVKIFIPLPNLGQDTCFGGTQKHKKLSDPIIGF
ncbi:cystatin-B-like isoform X2 [Mobula hypostoma]|uniref:cystatin-B-like isoform X2 n=1 Tax=Mobula hypostoma TaxID=723540 RepID=UPI002FC29F42